MLKSQSGLGFGAWQAEVQKVFKKSFVCQDIETRSPAWGRTTQSNCFDLLQAF
jgi:hypothetical protein